MKVKYKNKKGEYVDLKHFDLNVIEKSIDANKSTYNVGLSTKEINDVWRKFKTIDSGQY